MKQISIEKYIPKKHKNKVMDFYKDIDGCWLELSEDYISVDTETNTIHEDTIAGVKKKLKTIIHKEDFQKMNRTEINKLLI